MTYKRRNTRRKRKNSIKHRQSGGNVSLKATEVALCVYTHSDTFDLLEIQWPFFQKIC